MRSNGPLPWLAVVLAASCSPDAGGTVVVGTDAGARRDTGPVRDSGTRPPGTDGGVCADTDHDGLSDAVEGAPLRDTDGDGTPDFRDTDSDGDGFNDDVEARRVYPGYDTNPTTLICGGSGANCDGDSLPNHRDLDADNDGLTDREELTAMTDPCNPDTDGDGATDLVESAAGSNPHDAMSQPPTNSLYVVLPYYPPPMSGTHEFREFTFSTHIRLADVFFLVDNSSSMQPVINNLRDNLSTMVSQIQMAIPDVRIGVGSFDSMPNAPASNPLGGDGIGGSPGDYTLWVRQAMSPDVSAAQRAFMGMHTIDADTGGNFVGGDGPEDQTEAIFEVIQGAGSHGHETDPAALRSVHSALDSAGNGWVPAVDPVRDCGSTTDAPRYGWACFGEGRVPIIVLASDAPWYDGCFADDAGRYRSSTGHNCGETITALNARGGFFVGLDVGSGIGGFTYNNARVLAMRSNTVDGAGAPVVFGPGRNLGAISGQVVMAIQSLANSSRQDITTHTEGDPMAMGIPSGHTTADFIKAVTPLRGDPPAPDGFDHFDATTFYSVSPTAHVTFRVDFFNDFVEGGATAKLFRATINVIGRGGTVVDTRPVFIVVPATGSGIGAPL